MNGRDNEESGMGLKVAKTGEVDGQSTNSPRTVQVSPPWGPNQKAQAWQVWRMGEAKIRINRSLFVSSPGATSCFLAVSQHTHWYRNGTRQLGRTKERNGERLTGNGKGSDRRSTGKTPQEDREKASFVNWLEYGTQCPSARTMKGVVSLIKNKNRPGPGASKRWRS